MKYTKLILQNFVLIMLALSIFHMWKGNMLEAIWILLMAFFFRISIWICKIREFIHNLYITIEEETEEE